MADNFDGLSRLDRRRFLATLLALPAAAALPAMMREQGDITRDTYEWDAVNWDGHNFVSAEDYWHVVNGPIDKNRSYLIYQDGQQPSDAIPYRRIS